MLNLSIDLETFSSVPIAKAGAYKYVQSPDFEILLMAYSVDSNEPEIIDLAQGETIPQWLYEAIRSPDYIKHAYNAAFEWYCLSKFYGTLLPVNQWRDTMLHGLYCGFTAGLDATGKALGLAPDKQKLTVGKSLIRYFCVPCNPTITNGQRRRNLPKHDPAKWELFKTYCKGDVITEMEIDRKLSAFPVPDEIEKQWQTDLIINARGVAVDMDLVHGALQIGNSTREKLMQEAIRITGLENPNSIAQLSRWLEAETNETVPDLRKETVAALLEGQLVTGDAERMLEIRQELGKTSTKKYDAIEACVGIDGRVRGLLQFYGANRTGRWCLTGDHEVLTTHGWMRIDEWRGGYIACWHPIGETVSFQNAEQVSFDYNGPMYEYRDKRIDQISTPDHKMYVRRVYRGEWITDTVKNMQAYRPSIPFTGWRRTTPGQEHEKLRVLVMVQADGHYTEDGAIRFHFKKSRKIERCKTLLRRAEVIFVERAYSDRIAIQIPARCVPLWLRQFRDKTFGTWLFDESPDVFFDELVYWDGYRSAKNSIQYCTCNKVNADLVQAFAHMSGRAALMRVRHRSDEHENWQDAYCVDIWHNPGNSHEIKSKATINVYSGKVYCAVTPTGYFLVRRNGRVWVTGNSGRLVQVQNLPRTYLEQLDVARAAVKKQQADTLRFCFGSINDTLSQLIRTSFVAAHGNKLVDADFSSIEARIISWLAQESWRLEVFRQGGDIYCMSASNMFGVPVVKHGENGHLRQKGKIAELACIAEGQLVLTDKGLVPIERVTLDMKLWDGEEWVTHGGIVYRGKKEVIEYDGLTATTDHFVWVAGESRPVRFELAASCGARLVQTGDSGQAIRLGEDYQPRETLEREMESVLRSNAMHWMRQSAMANSLEPNKRSVKRLSKLFATEANTEVARQTTNNSKATLRKSTRPRISELRSKRYQVQFPINLGCRAVDSTECIGCVSGKGIRPYRYKSGLRTRKHPFCTPQRESSEQANKCNTVLRTARMALRQSCCYTNVISREVSARNYRIGEKSRSRETEELARYQGKVRVYDIRNAGPRHRFTVSGKLVHNCGYGGSVGALIAMGALKMGIPEEDLPDIVSRWRDANQRIVELWYKVESAAVSTIQTGRQEGVNNLIFSREFDLANGLDFMTITLPSGRKLYYAHPELGVNQWNRPSINYLGVNQTTKQWTRIETYSGKLVENVVQAIARDCLAVAIERLEAAGFPVVFHVHDEVVIDCPESQANLDEVVELMTKPIPWALGLPLNADGWVGDFFKKD